MRKHLTARDVAEEIISDHAFDIEYLQEAAAERRRWGYSFNPNDVVFLIDKVVNLSA